MEARRNLFALLLPLALLFGCDAWTSAETSVPDAAADAYATPAPLEVQAGEPARNACPAPDAPVAEPYRWYPALDLARIPFHVSDGPWGARAPIMAPSPPSIKRRITVTTAEQLAREALVPGSEITVAASIDRTVTLLGNVTDLDLIVPPGITLSDIHVGRAVPPSISRRVRIRGTTPGVHSGGRLGRITFHSDISDVIVDGVDLNSAGGDLNALAWHIATNTGARFAIINVRAHAIASVALHGHVTDLVIAGNHLVGGARSVEANGFPEGWGLRGGKRIVVFDNRIEGNRFHRVRVHPRDTGEEYAWIADNILVDPYEARIAWARALPGATTPWDGFWAVCNRIYAHSDPASGCLTHSFEAADASYARLTNNVFFGTITAADQAARAKGDQDYTTGNVYAPWQAPPPWESPGDPRTIALPVPGSPAPQNPRCPGPD